VIAETCTHFSYIEYWSNAVLSLNVVFIGLFPLQLAFRRIESVPAPEEEEEEAMTDHWYVSRPNLYSCWAVSGMGVDPSLHSDDSTLERQIAAYHDKFYDARPTEILLGRFCRMSSVTRIFSLRWKYLWTTSVPYKNTNTNQWRRPRSPLDRWLWQGPQQAYVRIWETVRFRHRSIPDWDVT